MPMMFVKAAAAAVALTFVAGAALPAFAQDSQPPVYFDLGFDVTNLPKDSAGAKKWLAAEPADTQRVIQAACDNYIKHPIAADMPETVQFCTALLAK